MLTGKDLLDATLAARIGSLDTSTLREIACICDEAILAVLGRDIGSYLSKDVLLAERVVPWVWDLARGLHYQSLRGPEAPPTSQLVDELSQGASIPVDRDLIADKIDWAFILTEDRVAQFVQGRGAISRDPIKREQAFPWYERLRIGYRIRLTTEALRLLPSS